MNRGKSTPKRMTGSSQPKRPKLDFPTKSSPDQPKDSSNGSFTKNSTIANAEIQKVQYLASAFDWDDDDDDFPSDMLEKVCEIADRSQAMVNNKPMEITESKHSFRRTISLTDDTRNRSNLLQNEEWLRLENEKLMENIKMKEGEVQILRSQLKQNQEAKEVETLNNTRLMKEIENCYKEKLEACQRDVDAANTEIEFERLERKKVVERYKQLESSTSKVRLVEPEVLKPHVLDSMCDSYSTNNIKVIVLNLEKPPDFEIPTEPLEEGPTFASLISPEYFNSSEEPNVILMYKLRCSYGFHVSSFDFDRREKYIWSGLPQQSAFLKDTYDMVGRLFLLDNFSDNIAKDIIENLLNISMRILNYQRELLAFLENVQGKTIEYEDSDFKHLENKEEVSMITIKHLLGVNKITKQECALESRRVLAMVVSLTMSSKSVLKMVIDKPGFVPLLKDLVTSVGNLRKPIRYTGILAGVTLLLTQLFQESSLEQGITTVFNEIIEEIIFARPKLDVLTLVVDALGMANNHFNFLEALCRKSPIESYTLYMDAKFRQAMFFRKDACPFKLLFTQIMGLSCIPANREMRLNVTRSVTKWMHRMMDSPFHHEIKWMPTTWYLESDEKCFDVMECCSYLLNCCLKDYFLILNFRDEVSDQRRSDILSVVGDGCLLFRRILMSDQRLLLERSHNLRFAVLLNNPSLLSGLRKDQNEAATWIIQLLKNFECCLKQNVSNSPTGNSNSYEDIMDSLKLTMT